MPTLEKSFRAPAYSPNLDRIEMLATLLALFLAWIVRPIFGCRHPRITLPFSGNQTCLDCGATRRYQFLDNFEQADAGIDIGAWRKAVRPQSAHRVVARTLMQNAVTFSEPMRIHPGPVDKIATITNRVYDRHMELAKNAAVQG